MIGWLDAAAGASGDMLLATVLDAGADEKLVRRSIAAVAPEPIDLRLERVQRAGLASLRAHIDVTESTTERRPADIAELLAKADLEPTIRDHAQAVFTTLADAEAAVHGVPVESIHFHEVGALDAIADIVGVCAGLASLDLAELHCSPVAVGSGTTTGAHGTMSVPPPAVTALLRGVPTYAGPVPREMCTPTGAAALRHWVTSWGPQPRMVVEQVGVGAGGRDIVGQANVLRLLVGSATEAGNAVEQGGPLGVATVLETNVDDLDPRLWPGVLQRLLDAGASDAWLAPILMKKGRPAHTLSVLARADVVEAVQAVVFAETSAIGMRTSIVGKVELAREVGEVMVGGEVVRVKLARSPYGDIVNVQPEYDDVARAAARLGRPVKAVLAEAIALAAARWPTGADARNSVTE